MIMVAPNGARRQIEDHAALPLTLENTLHAAAACFKAGADALHLHVREDDGRHSLDTGRYREALAALANELPDMRVQITTESAGVYTPAEQYACLQALKPDWASVSVREIAEDADTAARLYRDCAANGTEVQHILYGADCAAQLARWWQDGTVSPGQNSVIHVLGQYANAVHGSPDELTDRLDFYGVGEWMVCAFGDREHECLLAAHQAGGSVRVGFENSLGTADHRWRDNAESVAALRNLLKGNQERD